MFATGALAQPAAGQSDGLDTARARVVQLEGRISAAQREVKDAQVQLRSLSEQVGHEQGGLASTRHEIAGTKKRITHTKEQLGSLRDRLASRARRLYMQGPANVIGVVLGAESFGEFVGRVTYTSRLARHDGLLVLEARKIERELREIQDRQEQLEADHAGKLEALRSKQDLLTDAFAKQQGVLAELARSKSEALRLIADLESKLGAGALGDLRRVAGQGMTISYGEWAGSFLSSLGAPGSRSNRIAVVAWVASEGTQATWNPLATTKHMPGATQYNSHGVRNYLSKQQGIQASILTLELPSRGYEPVISRLRAGAEAMETAEAIRDSLWCSGCAGGTYVTGFIEAVTRYYDRYAN